MTFSFHILQLDENIYYQQMELLAKLNDKLAEKDEAAGGEVRIWSPAKDDIPIAINQQTQTSTVLY